MSGKLIFGISTVCLAFAAVITFNVFETQPSKQSASAPIEKTAFQKHPGGNSAAKHDKTALNHTHHTVVPEDKRSRSGNEPDLGGVDWSDNSSPYISYDNATLEALAENGDAAAAEYLSMRIYRTSPAEGQYQALVAGALSGKPGPIVTMVEQWMNSDTREALPYVLVAKKLGFDHAELHIKYYLEKELVSREDLKEAGKEADRLYSKMEQIRLQRLGVRLDDGRGT